MHARWLLAPTVLSAMLFATGVAGEPDRANSIAEERDVVPTVPTRTLTDGDLSELERIRAAIGSPAGTDAKSFRTALRQVAGPGQPLTPPRVEAPNVEDPALVAALRQSARHFETIAAAAEERDDYHAADEARETASRLWLEARRVRE